MLLDQGCGVALPERVQLAFGVVRQRVHGGTDRLSGCEVACRRQVVGPAAGLRCGRLLLAGFLCDVRLGAVVPDHHALLGHPFAHGGEVLIRFRLPRDTFAPARAGDDEFLPGAGHRHVEQPGGLLGQIPGDLLEPGLASFFKVRAVLHVREYRVDVRVAERFRWKVPREGEEGFRLGLVRCRVRVQHRHGVPLQPLGLVRGEDLHPILLHRYRPRGQAVLEAAGEFEEVQQPVQARARVCGDLIEQPVQVHCPGGGAAGEHFGADAEDVDDVGEQVA